MDLFLTCTQGLPWFLGFIDASLSGLSLIICRYGKISVLWERKNIVILTLVSWTWTCQCHMEASAVSHRQRIMAAVWHVCRSSALISTHFRCRGLNKRYHLEILVVILVIYACIYFANVDLIGVCADFLNLLNLPFRFMYYFLVAVSHGSV